MNRAEIHDEIAQALVASGCGYGSAVTERFADVVLEITLPEGPYGYCSTRECRNPAIAYVGELPVCHTCDDANKIAATLAVANADLARHHVSIGGDDWLDTVEKRVREGVAREFDSLAEVSRLGSVMETVYLYAAKLTRGYRLNEIDDYTEGTPK